MVDNGYDVEDYRQIDPSFGTMDDMDELIAEADRHHIKIVMDLVFNHTSDQCAWFTESKKSKDNPFSDYYIWRDAKEDGSAPTNWRSIFGGSAWEWSDERQQYYLHTFAKQQPDVNWECPELRKELYDIANFWAAKGVGGFRIDAITYIKKPAVFADGPVDDADGMSAVHAATANTPGILDFLHEFKREVMDGTDMFAVGEANGVDASELDQWVGDNGVFDMLFEFSHMHVTQDPSEIWYRDVDWKLTDLKKPLAESQEATATNGWYPAFFENHDQPRSTSNLMFAEGPLDDRAKVLGAALLTTRGTPFVFQGEELGYDNASWTSIDDFDDIQTSGQYDIALKAGKTPAEALDCCVRRSRDNARTPMQWDATENAGFTGGTPWLMVHADYAQQNVALEEADENSVLNWYRTLAKLRRDNPVLITGDWKSLVDKDEQILAFERTAGGTRMVTLCNWSDEVATYDASIVEGLAPVAVSTAEAKAGELAPLQAVIYG
jgi:alpha-glucosidase